MVESGRFIFGPEVQAFEEEAAAYLGVPHAIGVANGTDALVLALEAIGVGAGDEVICPSFTFYATAEAIARAGATPVFADIDPVTLNLDPEDVGRRIRERTKAIMPVHLFGRPAPLDGARRVGLPADRGRRPGLRGRRVSRHGRRSTFSFFPTKNLFALGDGGLVAATDDERRRAIRMLRFHGSRDKKTFELIGTNSRLDALQAAFLRIFLPQLAGWNASRREGPRAMRSSASASRRAAVDEPGHVYHMYVVARPSATGSPPRSPSAGSPPPRTTDAAPPPAGDGYLGWEPRLAARDGGAAAENLALPLWGGIDAEVQERVVDAVL